MTMADITNLELLRRIERLEQELFSQPTPAPAPTSAAITRDMIEQHFNWHLKQLEEFYIERMNNATTFAGSQAASGLWSKSRAETYALREALLRTLDPKPSRTDLLKQLDQLKFAAIAYGALPGSTPEDREAMKKMHKAENYLRRTIEEVTR